MRRIQLYLDDDLDHELGIQAARSGRTRSELVREAVRTMLGATSQPDPIDDLVGSLDIDPIADIDGVLYGS